MNDSPRDYSPGATSLPYPQEQVLRGESPRIDGTPRVTLRKGIAVTSGTFTRRDFLAGVACTALSGSILRAATAAPVRIGFGFSLYGMKSLKVAEALRVCAEIGYSGVELACLKDWPCDPAMLTKLDRKDLRRQLGDQALDLPSLMENLSLVVDDDVHRSNLERLKQVCELAHDLSPDSPPLVETVLGGKPAEWEAVKDRMVARLKDWAKVAAEQKTRLAIKAHVSGALHTPQDARWLVEQIGSPWVRLVYDYSHFQRQQMDLKETLALMLPDTIFVHIKDNVTAAGKTEFALPGDAGDIDYTAYLKQLRDAAFQGAVMVEVSGQVFSKPGYDPVMAARRCYANIQPSFVKAGLRAEV